MSLRAVCALAAVAVVAGCSSAGTPANDYRIVRETPPLTFPAGVETRPIKALYPVPPGPVPTTWPKKFKAPAPKPLIVADTVAQERPAAAASAEKPLLTQDGNGYPLLSISGDLNVIWDGLEHALRKANIKVEDRDQRIGLYYLKLSDEAGKDTPYQLRLIRGQTAYTMTLQKDDDTLAPKATSASLFEAIVGNWPGQGSQP